MLEGDFALCISLYHGYELLMQMGLRSLFFYLQGIVDGSRGWSSSFYIIILSFSTWNDLDLRISFFFFFFSEMTRARNELQRTPIFVQLYHDMEQMFMRPPAGVQLFFKL